MIYFDWMNHAGFGAIRQELWAFLHFPFHLALVLMVEGAAQFIVWRKVVEVVRYVLQSHIAGIPANKIYQWDQQGVLSCTDKIHVRKYK